MSQFASASSWISSWPFAPAITDLILDCSDTITAVSAMGAAIHPVFTTLHAGPQWRTVTICGTSMPENFVGFAAGQYSIQRLEVAVWKRLSKLALPYRLDFGDY